MFVVCVEFEIMPQYLDDFLAAMLKNAAKSYELELGCQQFDVCQEQRFHPTLDKKHIFYYIILLN